MKAVVVRGPCRFDQAEIAEIPDPTPGFGEVIVAVKAAEVNYPDILVIEGKYQVKPPLPFSPGKAATGVIESIGEGVSDLQPGDRVAVQVEYGAYAEKLCAAAANCYHMPNGMPFDKGAALGLVYQTAYFSLLDRGGLRIGETVLVLGGSGGIGLASVQLAKALGAGKVIAGVRGRENAAFIRKMGAEHVIDLSMSDLRDGLRTAVRELTGGEGANIVIDPIGGAATEAALRALAWRGRLVIVGFASGNIHRVAANYLLVKNIATIGLQWSDYREREPHHVAQVQSEIFDFYQKSLIDPYIGRTFPLERYGEALALLHHGNVQGKIILTIGE